MKNLVYRFAAWIFFKFDLYRFEFLENLYYRWCYVQDDWYENEFWEYYDDEGYWEEIESDDWYEPYPEIYYDDDEDVVDFYGDWHEHEDWYYEEEE